MSDRILVLGSTGNIGSFLVEILKERDIDFIAGAPAADIIKLNRIGVRSVEIDFSDFASLATAMQGVDRLFMLLPLEEPMTEWAENIINAAVKSMVKFIVRSSLMDAGPDSPYDLYRVHGRIDDLIRTCGISYAITHPNSFMQNFSVYYRDAIIDDDAFYFSHGSASISYTDVRDIAQANAEILINPSGHINREYDLTGPEALSDERIAAILSSVAGRTITYVPLTAEQYLAQLRAMNMTPWDVTMTMSLERHIRDGKSAPISNGIETLTGRRPGDFLSFARDFASSWKKNPVHA